MPPVPPGRRPIHRRDRCLRTLAAAALLATAASGCVLNTPHTTRRVAPERHPLGAKQVVLTVFGQPPPTAREVHRYRLNHGAQRAHAAPGPAFPWLPGAADWAVERLRDGGNAAGAVLERVDVLLEEGAGELEAAGPPAFPGLPVPAGLPLPAGSPCPPGMPCPPAAAGPIGPHGFPLPTGCGPDGRAVTVGPRATVVCE